MHNSTQTLMEYREKYEHIALFFRQTYIELNNINITFFHIGKHTVALEMLVYAIERIKHYTCGMFDAAYHRKYADKIIRRAMEALLREYGLPTKNSNGTPLPYGQRRYNDIDLYEIDKHHCVQEETDILLFNMALTHLKYWTTTSAHESLSKYLHIFKLVLGFLML